MGRARAVHRGPRWPLIGLELLLVVVLLIINPVRMSRETTVGKWAMWVLTAAITADNTTSAIVLDVHILSGQVSNNAGLLLGSGQRSSSPTSSCSASGSGNWTAVVRSPAGPATTRTPTSSSPDERSAERRTRLAPNVRRLPVRQLHQRRGVLPTDTMPLSRWAKMMMTLQSLVSISTTALVIARAVNVLK